MAFGGQEEIGCKLLSVGTLTLQTFELDPEGIVVFRGKLMVTDSRACNVHLYRRHDAKLLATSDRLEARPLGICICIINATEICVTLLHCTLEIMAITSTGDRDVITVKKRIKVNSAFDTCHGVARCMDDIVVCGAKNDTLYWCIVSLTDERVGEVHKICSGKWIVSQLTAKDSMVFISCNAGYGSPQSGVYAYDIKNYSQETFIYQHSGLNVPTGITLDSQGFLFVCNSESTNYCIHLLHHLRDKCELVTIYREGIPHYLQTIFFDHGIMYVACRNSKEINQYIPVYAHQQDPDHQSTLAKYYYEPQVEDEVKLKLGDTVNVTKQVDKGQSSLETEMSTSVLVPEDDRQGNSPVIPVEILHMDDSSIQLYKKALQDGMEKVYNIRVMVVGQYGVGKSVLTKHLLGQKVDIYERKSTEGIDVYKHCCKISLDTGQWIMQHEDSVQLNIIQRLMKMLSRPHQGPDVSQDQDGNMEIIYQRETTAEVDTTINRVISPSSGSDQEVQLTCSQLAELTFMKVDERHGVAHTEKKASTVAIPASEQEPRRKENKMDATMAILHLINENADKLEKDTVKYATLSIWDFAGQNIFYTTHQTFLTSRALYLLVIDLSQQVTDLIENDKCFHDIMGIKLNKVHDLVEIWMNSIHTCAPSPDADIPYVILVGTHVDKLSEKTRKEVIDKYFKDLRYILKDKPTIHHLMDDIAIDNTNSDPMLETLKRRIVELASQQPHWGEEKPARWLPLEQAIITIKASGAKVVPRGLIEDINMSGSVRIEDSDELDLFLRFHHEVGTILYFSVDGLREKIVLDPQWLIDALKSLITAETFIRKYPAITSKWYEFEETGKLTHELIDAIWKEKNNQEFRDNKDHILLLMEKLNIIAKPRSFTEDGKEFKEEDYYLAPCMLRQTMPKEIIYLEFEESTSVLCFVCKAKFLPPPVFHRLLGACLAKWPIAIKGSENLIYCGCCVFKPTEPQRLILYFRDYVIFVRVTSVEGTDTRSLTKLCSDARIFIYENLSRIIGNLGQGLEFEPHVKCPDSDVDSLDSLFSVSLLQTNEKVPCHSHGKIHNLNSGKLLKYWYENELTYDPVEQGYSLISDQTAPKRSKMLLQNEKIYHVFFIYANENMMWVKKTVERLENDHGFVCCEYDRDNTPGTQLLKFAEDSIRGAIKTVVVMTKEAFESWYVQHEIQMALQQHFSTGRKCLVPVLVQDCNIPDYLRIVNYVDARDSTKKNIWWPKLLKELQAQAGNDNALEAIGSNQHLSEETSTQQEQGDSKEDQQQLYMTTESGTWV